MDSNYHSRRQSRALSLRGSEEYKKDASMEKLAERVRTLINENEHQMSEWMLRSVLSLSAITGSNRTTVSWTRANSFLLFLTIRRLRDQSESFGVDNNARHLKLDAESRTWPVSQVQRTTCSRYKTTRTCYSSPIDRIFPHFEQPAARCIGRTRYYLSIASLAADKAGLARFTPD